MKGAVPLELLLFLSEPPCISALAAKLFCSAPMLKTFINSGCSWCFQYFLKRLLKQIAQRQIAFMIQTAGYHSPVAQYADLVSESVAEYMTAVFFRRKIRPVKLISIFKINPLPDADTPGFLFPLFGKSVVQGI